MLSLFEQIANNRLVKSIRKSVRKTAAYQTVDTFVRFAKSSNKIKGADEKIVAGLKGMGVVTREDALALERRIVQLEARINVLEHGPEIRATARKAEAARPAKTRAAGAESPARQARESAGKRTVAQATRSEEGAHPRIRDTEAPA